MTLDHIANDIKQFIIAEFLESRHLPIAPDGEYEPIEAREPWLLRLDQQFKDGLPLVENPKAIRAVLHAFRDGLEGNGLNDREHVLEDALDILSKCDQQGKLVKQLNSIAISSFYQSLPHPPASYIGSSKFREADGSCNNLLLSPVKIGKAGEPYARSVPGSTPIPIHDLPDPGLIFDALLRREDKGSPQENEHQNGNSALAFAFASLVTHTLFRTNPKDMTRNNTTSYLDLSPLYGANQDEQNSVRVKDGFGKLHPDTFSDDRLTRLPPAVSALLIIFNRNHNYIADMLLSINEKQSWKHPKELAAGSDLLKKQDEEIFQTARLVNCGHFMSIILGDYVAGFLGNASHGQCWHIRPFDPIHRLNGSSVGRGEGNHVSVEFNLLYRWHTTMSLKEEKWTEAAMSKIFGRSDWENITVKQVMQALERLAPNEDPQTRNHFPGLPLKRDLKTGKYDDAQLAAIIQDATNTPAHKFGAKSTPVSLRPVEVMSILQAREWGVCTMNEFRKFMGLKTFDSFEEWNRNPDIANAARQLYKHIDRLELYVGLQAEETMNVTYGSRFCCGYTTMRGILADAISLIRGDRYFTTEFIPQNLTAWGFDDCQPVANNGAFGACLPKLLLRHLPNNYPYNSVYGLFPFFTPKAMKKSPAILKSSEKYDFNEPRTVSGTVSLDTLQAIRTVFDDPVRFKVTYTDNMKYFTQNYGFFLVFDTKERHARDKKICMHALFPEGADSFAKYAAFYKSTIRKLIAQHSFKYPVSHLSPHKGTYVDIVKNVINLTSVRWVSDYLTGLSLKTIENPKGMFTEQEAYKMLMVLFMAVFENVAPEHGWLLRSSAKQVSDILNQAIKGSLEQVTPPASYFTSLATGVLTKLLGTTIERKPCHDFLSRLAEGGRREGLTEDQLTACVMGLAVGSSVNYAQACAQIIDFYLDDARLQERTEIVHLVHRTDAESENLLLGYVKEAQRLAPQFAGLFRQYVGEKPTVVEQGSGKDPVTVHPGQIVFGSYYNAQTNPDDFPEPFKVNPRRDRSKYVVQGIGFHGCPGVDYSEKTLVPVLREIFKLKNLRRAPGADGKLASFMTTQSGTTLKLFLDETGAMSPWPGSLMVVYDE